jgi:hypothetical protein
MFTRAKYKQGQDWTSLENPAASVKLDGGHYFLAIDNHGEAKFISRRKGVKGNYPERQASLPHLSGPYPEDFRGNVFSVELIHTGHHPGPESHPQASGILNSLPDRAMATQVATGPIRAVLLDVIHPALPTYGQKISYLKSLETQYNKPNVLYAIPVETNPSRIADLIDSTRSEGREGVIITSMTAPETNNPRIKIKHCQTYNLVVTGITQEVGQDTRPKESAGALIVSDSTGREVASVGTGLSHDLRKEIWKNKPAWIGKLIQVKTFGLKVNRLASPVFNGDADGEVDTIPS